MFLGKRPSVVSFTNEGMISRGFISAFSRMARSTFLSMRVGALGDIMVCEIVDCQVPRGHLGLPAGLALVYRPGQAPQGVQMPFFDRWESIVIAAIGLFLVWCVGVRIALVLGQIRAVGDPERDVTALLKRAAVEMSNQSPEQEATEVTYLLDAIGQRIEPETYRRMLEQVQMGIAAHLTAAR